MKEFNPQDYWEKRLSKNYGLHGVGFLKLGKNFNNWQYRLRKRVFIDRIKSMNIDLNRVDVLDVGSGTGFYVDNWKELGVNKVVGSDITNVAVEKLKDKYPNDDFFQIDIGSDISKVKGRNFDLVSAFDMLFHIVDDEKYKCAIKNIKSLVKPGGYFVFSDFFLHYETDRMEHQVSRSLDEVSEILNEAGFEIVDRYPMFYLMNYPLDSKNMLPKWLWKGMAATVMLSEIMGYLVGALIYPIELLLVSLFKESPTTEIMVCRRKD